MMTEVTMGIKTCATLKAHIKNVSVAETFVGVGNGVPEYAQIPAKVTTQNKLRGTSIISALARDIR